MEKAVYIDNNGGPEVFDLRDQEVPVPAAGEITIRNSAIGLNFIDIYQRKGLYPVSFPAILGQEGAGIVEAVGDGVSDFSPGDRVAYLSGHGAYASITACSAATVAAIPAGVSDEDAAAVFLKGLTVEMLVRQVFALQAGQSCLIYAASGGVGTLLTQWASHIGAQIIGVVGSEEKAVTARANGADEIIIRTKSNDIADDVRRITNGKGVDVVYDSVGAATFEASLDSLAMRGHMVTFGNASGPVPAVQPLDLSRRGSLTLTRPTLYHYTTAERFPEMAATLFEMIAAGHLKPNVTNRYPLAQIGDAHRALESGQTQGAIVITP